MKQRRAFTLVELLVVIGIIAVLIAILLPSLLGARRQAQMVACLSNQRQLVLALTMYAQENKGYFPGGDRYGDASGFYAHWDPTEWNPYALNNDPNHKSPKFLSKYVSGTKGLSRCPASVTEYKDADLWNGILVMATSYWYPNSLLITPEMVRNGWSTPTPVYPAQFPQKLSNVRHPTEKIVIVDYKTYHQPNTTQINLISPGGPDATGAKGKRGVPMAFADGHAAILQTSDMRRPDVNWTGHYPGNDRNNPSAEFGILGKDVW